MILVGEIRWPQDGGCLKFEEFGLAKVRGKKPKKLNLIKGNLNVLGYFEYVGYNHWFYWFL